MMDLNNLQKCRSPLAIIEAMIFVLMAALLPLLLTIQHFQSGARFADMEILTSVAVATASTIAFLSVLQIHGQPSPLWILQHDMRGRLSQRHQMVGKHTNVNRKVDASSATLAQCLDAAPKNGPAVGDKMGIAMAATLVPLMILLFTPLASIVAKVYVVLTVSTGLSFAVSSYATSWAPRVHDLSIEFICAKRCMILLPIGAAIAFWVVLATGISVAELLLVVIGWTVMQLFFLHLFLAPRHANTSWSTNVQNVFTLGEWITVSSLVALLITDYFIRYCLPLIIYAFTNILIRDKTSWVYNNYFADISSGGAVCTSPTKTHLVVAHSGLVGCILGCLIPSLLSKKAAKFVLNTLDRGDEESATLVIKCFEKIFIALLTILLSVDVALSQCLEEQSGVETLSSLWIDLTVHGTVTTYVALVQCGRRIMKIAIVPIRWLIEFLLDSELQWRDFSDNHSMHWMALAPRGIWLFYWVAVLLFFVLPTSIWIAVRLQQIRIDREKKKWTVVSRKFFHFVAVLLFAPTTYFAPNMMSLSYAVSAAVLLILEALRMMMTTTTTRTVWRLQSWTSLDNGPRDRNCLGKGNGIERRGDNKWTRRRQFTLNDFYESFFDERDKRVDKNGGFVITHIALICGCAAPLWLQELVSDCFSNEAALQLSWESCQASQSMRMLPFLGIIVLGVGDAAAAIAGSFWGRRRWPGSQRTMEGSLAMLISTIFCDLVVYCVYDGTRNWLNRLKRGAWIWIPLTALEASTTQIDNLCLPLAGACLVLLQTRVLNLYSSV